MIQSGEYLHVLALNLRLLPLPYLFESVFHEVAELSQLAFIVIVINLISLIALLCSQRHNGAFRITIANWHDYRLPRLRIIVAEFAHAYFAFHLLQTQALVVK